MGLGATVGADLLAVPMPKMVLSLAQAIAKGQTALDIASVNTLKVLAATKFDYIPEITETLTPNPITTSPRRSAATSTTRRPIPIRTPPRVRACCGRPCAPRRRRNGSCRDSSP